MVDNQSNNEMSNASVGSEFDKNKVMSFSDNTLTKNQTRHVGQQEHDSHTSVQADMDDSSINDFFFVPEYHLIDQDSTSHPSSEYSTDHTREPYSHIDLRDSDFVFSHNRREPCDVQSFTNMNTYDMNTRRETDLWPWQQNQDTPNDRPSMNLNERGGSLQGEEQDGIIRWITVNPPKKDSQQRSPIKVAYNMDGYQLADYEITFKRRNCVYPSAMARPDEYHGNRYAYESDCNMMAWRLALLNPLLESQRGLLQRAVDIYRNNCGNPAVRSRRAQRQAKRRRRRPPM